MQRTIQGKVFTVARPNPGNYFVVIAADGTYLSAYARPGNPQWCVTYDEAIKSISFAGMLGYLQDSNLLDKTPPMTDDERRAAEIAYGWEE